MHVRVHSQTQMLWFLKTLISIADAEPVAGALKGLSAGEALCVFPADGMLHLVAGEADVYLFEEANDM